MLDKGNYLPAQGVGAGKDAHDERERPARGQVPSRPVGGRGFACFGLGALGAVLPVLPTVPFLLGAAYCFARSSERLDAWFHGTKLYRTVLEGFAKKRAMTVKAKLMLLGPVTLVLGASFLLMANVPVGRAVVAAVWVAHVAYFGFIVKTDRGSATERGSERVVERTEG